MVCSKYLEIYYFIYILHPCPWMGLKWAGRLTYILQRLVGGVKIKAPPLKVTNIRLVSKKGLNNDMTCPAKRRRRKYIYVFMIFSCPIMKIFSYNYLHIDHLSKKCLVLKSGSNSGNFQATVSVEISLDNSFYYNSNNIY